MNEGACPSIGVPKGLAPLRLGKITTLFASKNTITAGFPICCWIVMHEYAVDTIRPTGA